MEKGYGAGSDEEEFGEEEFGATMGAPKSSKFSSGSGSSIVRGSTSTGSVSASSSDRVGTGTLSSSDAADTATEERSEERRRRGDVIGFDEDDEDQVERLRRDETSPFRIAIGVLFADAVSAATWLGPARACVLERIEKNRNRSSRRVKRDSWLSLFSS